MIILPSSVYVSEINRSNGGKFETHIHGYQYLDAILYNSDHAEDIYIKYQEDIFITIIHQFITNFKNYIDIYDYVNNHLPFHHAACIIILCRTPYIYIYIFMLFTFCQNNI